MAEVSALTFPEQDAFDTYEDYQAAVAEWQVSGTHHAVDGTVIAVGAHFWDNDLKVVRITGTPKAHNSRPYPGTGEISTWHPHTHGSSDTLTGRMRPYGRLTGTYEGKKAADYPPGTDYASVR